MAQSIELADDIMALVRREGICEAGRSLGRYSIGRGSAARSSNTAGSIMPA